MEIKRKKSFKNGTVYCLELEDGMLIETTDTFLPYYTKDAIGRNQNLLDSTELGDRSERWMIGVSVMSGCPVRCKFCATGQMKGYRNLSADEIVEQVLFIVKHVSQAVWKALFIVKHASQAVWKVLFIAKRFATQKNKAKW